MIISVWAPGDKWTELNLNSAEVEIIQAQDEGSFLKADAGLYINLNENAAEINYDRILKPLIVNSVVTTCKEINAPSVCRINGWNGFLQRPVWEVAGNLSQEAAVFFSLCQKKIIPVRDEPGMISAKVLAMIINEAWFALEAGISTKEEIDIAMKLGTNYPMGPFEWGEKIGLLAIYRLLQKMAVTEKRYVPCKLLQSQIIQKECP